MFGYISANKMKLIQKQVNRSSKKALNCIAMLSSKKYENYLLIRMTFSSKNAQKLINTMTWPWFFPACPRKNISILWKKETQWLQFVVPLPFFQTIAQWFARQGTRMRIPLKWGYDPGLNDKNNPRSRYEISRQNKANGACSPRKIRKIQSMFTWKTRKINWVPETSKLNQNFTNNALRIEASSWPKHTLPASTARNVKPLCFHGKILVFRFRDPPVVATVRGERRDTHFCTTPGNAIRDSQFSVGTLLTATDKQSRRVKLDDVNLPLILWHPPYFPFPEKAFCLVLPM